jgi:hypothetical protein
VTPARAGFELAQGFSYKAFCCEAFCHEAFCYRCDEVFHVCFSKRDG